MKKQIIGKNGHSNEIDTDKIECIKLMETKIIIYFDSRNYLTILNCAEEKDRLLEQLEDNTTTEIRTQCSVKYVLQSNKTSQ